MRKKKFAVSTFNPEYKTLVIYIIALSVGLNDEVYPSKKHYKAYLKVDKALIKDFNEYTNFADVFSSKLAVKLPKYMSINNYAIKFIDY